MKLVLIAFALLAQSAFAFTQQDLVGTWSGRQFQTVDGQTVVQTITIRYRIFQQTGLVEQTSVQTANGVERTLTRYLPEASRGRLVSTTKLNGKTIREAGGNWYFAGRLLYAGLNSTDRFGAVNTRLAKGGSVLTIDASFSDGVQITGRLRRQ